MQLADARLMSFHISAMLGCVTAALRSPQKAAIPVALLASLIVSCTIAGCRTQQHSFDVTGELWVPSAVEHYGQALRTARDWKAYDTNVTLGYIIRAVDEAGDKYEIPRQLEPWVGQEGPMRCWGGP